jgi:hypothetical protein
MKWSERQIASYLARFTFDKKHLVIVPNCSWPGSECDLLVVTPNLRIIDVEIKISRGDLKADRNKDKWFHHWNYKIDGPWKPGEIMPRRPRAWPHRVWKHYYCMPETVWKNEFLAEINPTSGVLTIREHRHEDGFYVYCLRMAKPNREADKLNAEDAIDIARLASLRMWDAYKELDDARRERQAA